MHTGTIAKLIIAASVISFLSGCVTRRTVTQSGKTVKSSYVVKAPFTKPVAN